MNIHLYICLQYTVLNQSLGVTVESVSYDVAVYASITVKKNVVSVTLYVTIGGGTTGAQGARAPLK